MKTRFALLFLSFISCSFLYSHQDSFYAIEESNVHIKVKTDRGSWQTIILRAYAPIINEFICEIDPQEKVFIQFNEDYCYLDSTYNYVSYGRFNDVLIPGGFPWGMEYDMKFLQNETGLCILIQEKFVKLEPILKQIEYGLRNKDKLIDQLTYEADFSRFGYSEMTEEQKLQFKGILFETKFNAVEKDITEQILNSQRTSKQHKYLSKSILLADSIKEFSRDNVSLYLQNDSLHFYSKTADTFLTVSTIERILKEETTQSYFLLDSNRSYYYINNNYYCDGLKNKLTFEVGCSDRALVKYQPQLNRFVIGNAFYSWGISEKLLYKQRTFHYPEDSVEIMKRLESIEYNQKKAVSDNTKKHYFKLGAILLFILLSLIAIITFKNR